MKRNYYPRFPSFLLALLLLLPLWGCSAASESESGSASASQSTAPQITGLDPDQIQFFQAKTSYWEQEIPQQYVLPSAADFQAFSAAHSHIAEDPAFIDAVGILDQSFFDEHILLCALVTTGSGSDRYAVTGLEQGPDGVLTMTARCTTAELGTADLAEWFLLAQGPRDALDSVPENFQLVLE